MNKITITVGDELFSFKSFQQWVNKAHGWFKGSGYNSFDTICIDAKGRICTCGAEFKRADAEKTFPIKVYAAVVK